MIDSNRFSLDSSEPVDPTLPATTAIRESDDPEPVSGPRRDEPFTSGTVLAGRYRLVAHLGRGGMGEVYRAEDLKLGETVAIKFLPSRLEMDAVALKRFHREVRMSRQIAHRNVCRVFDIGSADGRHFLTMEYIDGEDLASLLRRIGRLPADKALQLSRQLGAGLAAAHEAGILHRDLKPANVMIDGRGRAKITDFGLAHLVDELQDRRQWIGTPAYMAPEQLQGETVDIRTDLYAAGLVIYEMFTGAKPFPAEDPMELLSRGRRQEPPLPPREHVPSLEPATEEVILDLLADDPVDRPRSAVEMLAALPGGDPLAAALAAGETPSPEMVAAAPDRGVLSRRTAGAALGSVLLLLLCTHWLGQRSLLGYAPPQKPPAVLEDRVQSVLREIGWQGESLDRLGYYRFEEDRLDQAERDLRAPTTAAWKRRAESRPMLLTYWYRQSPEPLLPWRVAWAPQPFDPPPSYGEAFVVLDAQGRLERLRIESSTSSQLWTDAPGPTADIPWEPLFSAAELDFDRFRAVEDSGPAPWDLPEHDSRSAWVGEGDHGEALRIDFATLGGHPVFFQLSAARPGSPAGDPPASTRKEPTDAVGKTPIPAGQELLLITFFLLMATALVLAYRHLRGGRADRRSAGVLGTFVAAISLLGLLFGAHHPPSGAGLFLMLEILEASVFRGAAVVLVYLALEPVIRRRAPEVLVTSTRLLVGRWQDPRVGRDLLAGLVLGTAAVAVCAAINYFSALTAVPLAIYAVGDKLAGLGGTLYWMTFSLFLEVSGSLLLCLLYAVLVAWTRRKMLAAAGLWALAATLGGFSPIAMLGALLFVVSLSRFGLLTTVIAWTCIDWILFFPTGAGPGDWWFLRAWLPSLVLVGLTIIAARQATGARLVRRAPARPSGSWTRSQARSRGAISSGLFRFRS